MKYNNKLIHLHLKLTLCNLLLRTMKGMKDEKCNLIHMMSYLTMKFVDIIFLTGT